MFVHHLQTKTPNRWEVIERLCSAGIPQRFVHSTLIYHCYSSDEQSPWQLVCWATMQQGVLLSVLHVSSARVQHWECHLDNFASLQ